MLGKHVFFIGGADQARLCQLTIERQGYRVTTVFDRNSALPPPFDCDFFHDPDMIESKARSCGSFLVCIGGAHGVSRAEYSERLLRAGLAPISALHPAAYLPDTVTVGRGLQTMPHAVVNDFVRIGDWCILNTNCTVDHDCRIGDGVHIMGGASVAGRVVIDDFATIGTNATVLPGLHIGRAAFVGAGAVVTRDVAPGQTVIGVPARPMA